MLRRKYLFPNVIELNYQAGRKLGVNVYLLDGGGDFAIIDIGYEESVPEVVELVRQMDFNLSRCKYLIATHADADHVQGIARAKELFKAPVAAHPLSVSAIESGDVETTFARITAQNIDMPMPPCKVDVEIKNGDVLEIGKVQLEVWHTPGHTPGQLSFKTGELLFVGDNIYKDGCVGVIDAHHGSNLPDFIASLKRIRDDDSPFLLPSHGPAFRRDDKLLKKAIDRLTQYQHMADFGTCAVDWPLLDEWEQDVLSGKMPKF
jgi:glyoxylase-like metal-dependent hydrolase (beta-lactamase superfamily II)